MGYQLIEPSKAIALRHVAQVVDHLNKLCPEVADVLQRLNVDAGAWNVFWLNLRDSLEDDS